MAIGVLLLLFLVWLVPFLFLWRIPAPGREAGPEKTGEHAAVSVIIPARNEEKTLPLLLGSLSTQPMRVREIVVVNDHSQDDTARIAREYGAAVVESKPLPEGWLGKPWACWQGAQCAAGQVFIFLDADTELEPGGLPRILAAYSRHGGLLSIWPYHRMRLLYERLSALFNIIIMASMGSFAIGGPRNLGAFGPCVVCSRSDYFTVGGHRAVKCAILEDVALGKVFLKTGFPLHNYGGRGAISFRMYPAGLGSLITGFGKGMASGAQTVKLGILLPMILWVAGGFVGFVVLPILALTSGLQAAAPWLALNILYILQLHWILARMGNYRFYTSVLYPIPFAFFAGVFVVSLLRTFLLREVSWKGRKIEIKR